MPTLRKLREHRRPYDRLARALVDALLRQYAAVPDAPLVEIGAGDGQLCEWLPERALGRTLHTEPVAAAVDELRARFPGALIRRARAEALPLADGSVDAAIGLCVLDVVPEGAAVARELARVLRPGGHFIHVLDVSTYLAGLLREWVLLGAVPFPNVFFDPCATRWPEDVLLVPTSQVWRVLELLTRADHPLAAPLQQYLEAFVAVPFHEKRALAEYSQLSESPTHRDLVRQLFEAAFQLAGPDLRDELAGFHRNTLASSRCFERRLRNWFTPADGFTVIESTIVAAAERTAPAVRGFRYQSMCVGELRRLPSPPDPPLCPDVQSLTPASLGPDEVVQEFGAFVFIARRLAP